MATLTFNPVLPLTQFSEFLTNDFRQGDPRTIARSQKFIAGAALLIHSEMLLG